MINKKSLNKTTIKKKDKSNPKSKYFFDFIESNYFNIIILILAVFCVFSSLIYSILCYLGKAGDFGSSFYLLIPSVIFLIYCFKSKFNAFWSKAIQIIVSIVIALSLLVVFFLVIENSFTHSFDILMLGSILVVVILFVLLYLILLLFKKQKIINSSQLFNVVFFFFLLILLILNLSMFIY